MADSLSSTECDPGTGPSPAEASDNSLPKQKPIVEHSSQQQEGNGLDGKNLVTVSLSTLSISAEPFKSTSFDQSAATQLSADAKEFVPKTAPVMSYDKSYQTYMVQNIVNL